MIAYTLATMALPRPLLSATHTTRKATFATVDDATWWKPFSERPTPWDPHERRKRVSYAPAIHVHAPWICSMAIAVWDEDGGARCLASRSWREQLSRSLPRAARKGRRVGELL